MDKNNHILNKWKLFFYPLYPHHLFKSVRLMTILAVLIALRLLFGYINVPLPGVELSISIAWVPLMMIGWIFGPIYGFIVGIITDTISFLITPTSVWFWMYAIQEPIVGMLAGIFQGICYLRITKNNRNLIYDLLFEQITIIVFSITSMLSLLLWVDKGNIEYFNIYQIISVILIIIYLITMEIFTFIFLKSNEKNKQKILIFIYAGTLVTIITITFSFLLGPISAIQYLYYINGVYPENYIKYGTIFYLIPRILIESIKSPLETFILTSLIFATKPMMDRIYNYLNNQW